VKAHPAHLWTEEDDANLKRLVDQAFSARKISEHFGKSRNAVIGRVHRLGLKLKGRPPANIMAVKAKRERPTRAVQPDRTPAVAKDAKAAPALPVAIPAFPDLDSYFRPLPGTEAVPLAEMAGGMCHWPVNGRYGREPIYCGLPADGPYCPVHHRLAYQPKSSLQEKRHGACA
jgi:GcrA cell cycle regulator